MACFHYHPHACATYVHAAAHVGGICVRVMVVASRWINPLRITVSGWPPYQAGRCCVNPLRITVSGWPPLDQPA
eukprot:2615761-Pyramimonas_sp.AAC.1